MSLIDLMLHPGVAVGCAVGIGAAVLLHWLFPGQDLTLAQALLVAFFAGVGMLWELVGSGRKKRGADE